MKHVDSSLHYKTFIHSSQLALSQCIKDQGITSFGKLYSHRMMQITVDLHSMDVNTTYTEGCVSCVEGLAYLQPSEDVSRKQSITTKMQQKKISKYS